MKVGIVSDHRGYKLKEYIKENLPNIELFDYGTFNEDSVDYPDYAFVLCEKIVLNEVNFGIAICGSGIGMSIACNKVKGIRCAKVTSTDEAIITRNDNDANVIALGADLEKEKVLEIIKLFIQTPFSNLERHSRRINKIKSFEEKE